MATWGELAVKIGISRSMLDFLKAGTKDAGPAVLRKIIAAEEAAGLRPPTPGETLSAGLQRPENAVREQRVDYGANIGARAELEAIRADVDRLLKRIDGVLAKIQDRRR